MTVDWHLRRGARANLDPPLFEAREIDDVNGWYARQELPATPLRSLPALAARLGIGEILVKDETARFGLPAFKILGAHHAIGRLVGRHGGRVPDLACATAGNHGRAVAAAGRRHGLGVHVFVPAGTATATVDALAAEGAAVVVTRAGYDETVRLMAAEAARRGWTIVSDTALTAGDPTPRDIMLGYTRLLDEAAAQWTAVPDVVVVQAGVGSLAGAMAGWLQARLPDRQRRPRLLIAEPIGSACVLASLRAGRAVTLDDCAPTMMTGLRCGRVSPLAWPVLQAETCAAVAFAEARDAEAMELLAHPAGGDPSIAAGPSGAAGLAALTAVMRETDLAAVRDRLAIQGTTRVLLIATEASGPRGSAP